MFFPLFRQERAWAQDTMSPSEVTVLAEEQGSAGGSSGPGQSPDPAQLIPERARHSDPTDTRLLRRQTGAVGAGAVPAGCFHADPAGEGVDTGVAQAHHCLEVWATAGRQPGGGLEPQITCWPKVG